MSDLRIFVPILKIDEEQRMVYGVLTEECADKSGEIFDYASGKPAVQAWSDAIKEASKGKSLGNVRAMHDSVAAGKFTNIVYDDANKRIEGAAKIVDDDEWAKCREGVYSGFSIGGSYTKRWQDKDNPSLWRFTPKLSEISLVDNPCVPTATFEYVKADGSVEMRKFTHSHQEDSMDPKALAAAKEALAKGTATDAQKALLAKADADALLKSAKDAEAKGEASDEQKALIAKAAPALVKDGKAVKPKAAPVQKWLADDGAPFDSKREAEVHNLHLEKQAELAPNLTEMDALLKAAKSKEDEDEDEDGDDEDTKKAKKARRDEKAAKAKEKAEKDDAEMAAKAKKDKDDADKAAADTLGKKDYSDKDRKAMADKGEALKDGSFPIKTKKDLENAVQAYGRAKDKDEAKAHIVARAKALDAEDMLPDDWKKNDKAAAAELKKGLQQVGWLAHMLDELTRFQDSVEIEQYFEDDKESELPAKLKSIVSEFCELLVTLVQEETSELSDGDDTDVEVLAMAAKVDAAHAGALAKHVKAEKLKAALEKAGARHSKADMEKFADMHKMVKDHADAMTKMADDHCDAMGKCMKDAGMISASDGDGEDDMEPSDKKGAKKMSKVLDALAESRAESGALTMVVSKMDNTLQEAVGVIKSYKADIDTLKQEKLELAKRMEHLEKQPAAPKGHVRAMTKAQDGGAGGETEAEYKARLAKMTQPERARELMKLSMSNPMEMPAL